MKKIIAFILYLSMLFMCACGNTQNENEISTESTQAEETTEDIQKNENNIFSDYKYRYRYYSISAPFIELVGDEVYNDWFYEKYYPVPIEERNEMAIVAFIKEFDISREDFDRANAIHNKNALSSQSDIITDVSQYKPGYDRAIECNETYNADIIYTFDNELINAYYLYVDPYEDESSTNEQVHDIEDCNCGADFTLDDMSMRYMYYSLTYPHAQLVEDKEAYDKWYDEIVVTDDMDEMLLVTFVKQFNIPKEDFEKANEEWIKFITDVRGRTPVTPPFDTAHEAELCEVPNADVIYTFDNEFIKEYYKRENANVTLEIPTTVGDGVLDVPNEETTVN